MFYKIIRFLFYIPISVLLPTKAFGKERLCRKGPFIVVCNHQSMLDVPVLIAKSRRPLSFMAKSTFFHNRFLNWLFRSMNAFPVNQRSSDIDSMRQSLAVLKDGGALGIFPQGTRYQDSPVIRREDFLDGFAFLALKAGVPIVPVMMEKHPWWFRFNRMYTGEEINMDKYKGRRINKELLAEVSDEVLEKMNALLPEQIRTGGKSK